MMNNDSTPHLRRYGILRLPRSAQIRPVAGFMSMWARPVLWIDSKPSKTSSKRASVRRLPLGHQ